MPAASVAHQDENFLRPLALHHAIDGRPVLLDHAGALIIQPNLTAGDAEGGEPDRGTTLAVDRREPIELAPETVELRRQRRRRSSGKRGEGGRAAVEVGGVQGNGGGSDGEERESSDEGIEGEEAAEVVEIGGLLADGRRRHGSGLGGGRKHMSGFKMAKD